MLSQLLTLRHLSSPTSSMPPSSSTSTSSCSLQPLLLSILQPSSRHHPHQRSLVEFRLGVHQTIILRHSDSHSFIHLPHQTTGKSSTHSHQKLSLHPTMFQQTMFVQSILFILQPAGSPVLSSTCVSILARLTTITCFSSSPLARHTNHFISCSVFLTFSTTSFTARKQTSRPHFSFLSGSDLRVLLLLILVHTADWAPCGDGCQRRGGH